MKKQQYKVRRTAGVIVLVLGAVIGIALNGDLYQPIMSANTVENVQSGSALEVLEVLEVKGRAPKTGYSRAQFGGGWERRDGCDMRNIILHRDLKAVVVNTDCQVISGKLDDPYTGKTIEFKKGVETSQEVQIDHVVALSDAWQKGAQQLNAQKRQELANDPLELLAVEGEANQQKGAGDAATWLPSNKIFRCQYVARQIAVKKKYNLWVTSAEKDAMVRILEGCPGQALP